MFSESAASTPSRLVIEGPIAGLTPTQVTAMFTDPTEVTRWWPQEATVDESGGYVFSWPAMDMVLRGDFVERQQGRLVQFTWSWDHEPEVPVRTVTVTTVGDHSGGTHLTVTHGDYGPDDAEERQGHLEGWQHFLAQMAAVASADDGGDEA